MRFGKAIRKVKPEIKEPVVIEEVKEPEPILCKAKGCSRYAEIQGFCKSCARDLQL